MRTNPIPLDVIQVSEPCSKSWEQMAGDERIRYCQGCRKHVYNLSAMTRSEAERLVCESAGNLCVRFGRLEDGRVQTLDYREPAGRPRGWRFWTVVSACVASLVAAVNGYALTRGRPTTPAVLLGKPAPTITVGGICAPPASSTKAPPAVSPLPQTEIAPD
jgi:hypothetical protein